MPILDNLIQLESFIELCREQGKKVVFTNGVFDILHIGHAKYLREAANKGDVLVVGINSDSSVKRLNKGDGRPYNSENDRAYLISELNCTDAVYIFNEDTPLNIIKTIKPDVLIKGGDYNAEESDETSVKYIVGSKEVIDQKGSVEVINFVHGYSTSSLVDKIRNPNGKS